MKTIWVEGEGNFLFSTIGRFQVAGLQELAKDLSTLLSIMETTWYMMENLGIMLGTSWNMMGTLWNILEQYIA